MSDIETGDAAGSLEFEYELDAPPEKVWRALNIPELRERWLPSAALAQPEPVSSVPGEEVRYRIREDEPLFLESTVTFTVRPIDEGRTVLRIVHRLTDERLSGKPPAAANDACFAVMLAA